MTRFVLLWTAVPVALALPYAAVELIWPVEALDDESVGVDDGLPPLALEGVLFILTLLAPLAHWVVLPGPWRRMPLWQWLALTVLVPLAFYLPVLVDSLMILLDPLDGFDPEAEPEDNLGWSFGVLTWLAENRLGQILARMIEYAGYGIAVLIMFGRVAWRFWTALLVGAWLAGAASHVLFRPGRETLPGATDYAIEVVLVALILGIATARGMLDTARAAGADGLGRGR